MSRNLEAELVSRSTETGLGVAVLRAVYLRECSQNPTFSPDGALKRVDSFILYALTRDTLHSRDRDLAPSAHTR